MLEKHLEEIEQSIPSVIFFMADDAARLGRFKDACQILHAFNEAVAQSGQVPIETFVGHER